MQISTERAWKLLNVLSFDYPHNKTGLADRRVSAHDDAERTLGWSISSVYALKEGI